MMQNNLEFKCIGVKEGEKFALDHTGRGKDISPEFIIKKLPILHF